MKKLLIGTIVVVLCTAPAAAATEWYVRGEVAWNKVNMDSGGLNTAGPHLNTGDDDDSGYSGGLGIGVKTHRWRFGLDIAQHNEYEFTTNSFQPPTPTFFYKSEIGLTTYMLSGNWEIRGSGKVIPFIGLGAGVVQIDADTDDNVVSGSETKNKFAWSASAGVSLQVTNKNYIEFAYRYLDPEELTIHLDGGGGPGSAGDLKTDLTAHQLLVGWRWMFH